MKKINSIHQLRDEQERLERKQAAIADELGKSWLRIKEQLTLGNLAKESVYSMIPTRKDVPKLISGIIKGGLFMGASVLLRRWIK